MKGRDILSSDNHLSVVLLFLSLPLDEHLVFLSFRYSPPSCRWWLLIRLSKITPRDCERGALSSFSHRREGREGHRVRITHDLLPSNTSWCEKRFKNIYSISSHSSLSLLVINDGLSSYSFFPLFVHLPWRGINHRIISMILWFVILQCLIDSPLSIPSTFRLANLLLFSSPSSIIHDNFPQKVKRQRERWWFRGITIILLSCNLWKGAVNACKYKQ